MELSDYIRILRAHWIVILIATVVGAGAAFGWSALQPKVYSADTTGIVTSVGGDGTSGAALVGNQLRPEQSEVLPQPGFLAGRRGARDR